MAILKMVDRKFNCNLSCLFRKKRKSYDYLF